LDTGTLITSLVIIVLGVATLLFGRHFHMLFVGLGGFLAGVVITTTVLNDWNTIVALLIATVIGVAFGALSIVTRRFVTALASFAGIGFFVLVLCAIVGIASPGNFILAGIAGAIAAVVMYMWFEWGLIVHSSLSGAGAVLAGATALLPALNAWGGMPALILTAALAAAGILFQGKYYRQAKGGHLPADARRSIG
jgi:hypothetical protein